MQKIEGGKKYQILFPPDLLKDIERISKRSKLTRAQTIRMMLYMGVDMYEKFEATGIIKVMEVCDRVEEIIKEKMEPRQLKLF